MPPLEPPKILLLSPHPDDIALDVGGLLALARNENRIGNDHALLCTVFTRSDYAPYSGLVCRSVDDVSQLRMREERRFATQIDADFIEGRIGDSSILGYSGDEECKASYSDDIRVAEVAELMEKLPPRPAVCFAPAGIGGHVDHQIVRDLALARFGSQCAMVLYEDLPYAAMLSDRELDQQIPNYIPAHFVEHFIDITQAIDTKISWLKNCYQSQLAESEWELIRQHASRFGCGSYFERIWIMNRSKQSGEVLANLLQMHGK